MPKNRNKTKKIDPKKCLPPELTRESMDNILCGIGFTWNSIKDYSKGPIVYNPVLKFTLLSLYLLNGLYNSFKEGKDPSSLIIAPLVEVGDGREHTLFLITSISLMALVTQFKFKGNPFNGVNVTTVGVLQMVSGSVPPIRLGLTNEQQIRRLVKVTKFLLAIDQLMKYCAYPSLYLEIMTNYSANSPLKGLNFLSELIIKAIFYIFWTIYVAGIIDNLFLIAWTNWFYFFLKNK